MNFLILDQIIEQQRSPLKEKSRIRDTENSCQLVAVSGKNFLKTYPLLILFNKGCLSIILVIVSLKYINTHIHSHK